MGTHTPIIAAADGSALGNPGPAGWAWYIDEKTWAAGGWKHGTNNMGELKAVLDLFEATAHVPQRPLTVICDSKYVIDSLTKWMPGWKKKGWKKSDGKPVLNQDLLKALDKAMQGRTCTFEWVKGHSGHPLNEAADARANAAATAFSKGKEPKTGPGFSRADVVSIFTGKIQTVEPRSKSEQESRRAHPTAYLNGDALDIADLQAEEEHSAEVAQMGPERLASHQEELLLREENFSDERKLDSFLADDFVWITPRGAIVSRQDVIAHRHRAFVVEGEPETVSSTILNENTALVTSRVFTKRGHVIRTSLWTRENYRNEIGAWVLRHRQESAT
ncbi:RNase H family protein [Rothia sp. ZJ932]|uniref:RNase H family protein n=1 Tax=Rothia sp. ZJ932 TaxID=2810516 RepID=UPI001968358E|nr:RNase H family protein [Rothia sp. ZJ932]QRZ61907.1 hypothetical protein JR346_01880 [Rothia sp. ZJ932]